MTDYQIVIWECHACNTFWRPKDWTRDDEGLPVCRVCGAIYLLDPESFIAFPRIASTPPTETTTSDRRATDG